MRLHVVRSDVGLIPCLSLGTLLLVIPVMHSLSGGYDVDDENLYTVSWKSRDVNTRSIDTLLMRTSRGERYECSIPPLGPSKLEVNHNYTNNLKDVFGQLFQAHPCNTRVEYYWAYELCHNKHIRQFHEEQHSEKGKVVQEYFLGFHSSEVDVLQTPSSSKPPEILLGEISYPYFEVVFTNGTLCDLTKSGRSTSVLYICHEGIDGGIVQVSELESCRYQLIFATKYLCANPAYTVQKRSSLAVTCAAETGTSPKPSALVEFEAERDKRSHIGVSNLAALFGSAFKHIQINAEHRENSIVYHIRAVNPESDAQPESDSQLDPSADEHGPSASSVPKGDPDSSQTAPAWTPTKRTNEHSRAATTSQLLGFLRGHFCLTGHQTGWWTHELCFGKNVTQFHQVIHGKRAQVIVLGLWDRKNHEDWVAEQPNMKHPAVNHDTRRNHALFYGAGEVCSEINDNRHAIVKLRCDLSANGIYLSFSEQSTCRYSVLVESAAFCDISDEDWRALVL